MRTWSLLMAFTERNVLYSIVLILGPFISTWSGDVSEIFPVMCVSSASLIP